jgi:hypothetical protein
VKFLECAAENKMFHTSAASKAEAMQSDTRMVLTLFELSDQESGIFDLSFVCFLFVVQRFIFDESPQPFRL